jgi:hypothetical protein
MFAVALGIDGRLATTRITSNRIGSMVWHRWAHQRPSAADPWESVVTFSGHPHQDSAQFDRPSSLTAARKTVGSAAATGTMACRAHAGRVACTRACVIAAYRQLARRQARS